ncbi:MAG: RdgB/HAM1 family non-canonical purine NTP pyrophosphatase [Flavobacteriales bacterium]|nr:RdgB/HAM1 family non-canonical purine NTP pyrophosphatase [Flavobacteriales bacterium]
MKKTEIVFATNNLHKLKEVQQAVGNKIILLSLKDINFKGEIPETQDTIEGNSKQKVEYIFERYNIPCFADDTGLIIDSLNGEPGVYSARYAGEACSFKDNCDKVLRNLAKKKDRKARFKTVISFMDQHGIKTFEGVVEGTILEEYKGSDGFGYDPIFKPVGYNETFAEMTTELKNEISHRGLAVKKLLLFLESYLP